MKEKKVKPGLHRFLYWLSWFLVIFFAVFILFFISQFLIASLSFVRYQMSRVIINKLDYLSWLPEKIREQKKDSSIIFKVEKKFNGKKVFHFNEWIDSIETAWKDGVLDGSYKVFSKKKLVFECKFKNGKQDGVARLFQYKEDEKTGNKTFSDIVYISAKFKNGRLHGETKVYSEDGNDFDSFHYTNGELLSED
ncbi:hypothetical protein ACFL35_07300 [Candidatus Riflebacteria bacterium]